VQEGIAEKGWLGIFTGGLTGTAGGIAFAVTLAFLCGLLFKSKDKS